MSLLALQGSVELGLIYAIMALGVFISFRTLNIPDLTVDSSFTLGAAVSAMLCTMGHPWLALPAALAAGYLAGNVTALLHTKLKIQPLLAGILVMLGLYSVNLRVMDGRANIPLLNQPTVFGSLQGTGLQSQAQWVIPLFLLIIVIFILFLFLQTRFGLVLRATGDNQQMVRAVGVNTDTTILFGLGLANGLVGLSGALIAQYQSFADVSMGVGMVIIGLASVIIGEVLFGISSLLRRLMAVVLGAILYRLVIAVALHLGMPPTDLKLVSAAIVSIALAAPVIKAGWISQRKKRSHRSTPREG
jgi:putative ABC transport system permease protein